jgi:hypothetical protein
MLPEDMRKQPGWKAIGTVATEWLDGWAAKNDTLRMARLPATEDDHRIMLARMGHPFETDMTPYAMGIAKLPDQIAAWSSVAGTSRWVRFVGFLLGTAVRVKPLYTRADVEGLPYADTLPGFAPFIRGPQLRDALGDGRQTLAKHVQLRLCLYLPGAPVLFELRPQRCGSQLRLLGFRPGGIRGAAQLLACPLPLHFPALAERPAGPRARPHP